MLVEFEKMFLIGCIFLNWWQMEANVLVELENVFFNWGHFLQLGAFFFKVEGKILFWDLEN